MIYKVIIREGDPGVSQSVVDVYHVHANSVAEAEAKALRQAKKDWKGIKARVSSVEETDIQFVE